jgi:hypothetical protein
MILSLATTFAAAAAAVSVVVGVVLFVVLWLSDGPVWSTDRSVVWSDEND